MNPDFPSDYAQWGALDHAAQSMGLTLLPIHVRQRAEFDDAFRKLGSQRPDALFAMNNGLNFTHRKVIIEYANTNRLPSMHSFTEATRDGALLSYAANRAELFRHAAIYAGRILKGARPADMPLEQPTQFALVVNLRTAKALGLTIPKELLLRVDEVIE
jgi:putative ABC transport system substrate-binding protein